MRDDLEAPWVGLHKEDWEDVIYGKDSDDEDPDAGD